MRNAAQHREVVGVFGDEAQLDQAVQALEIADFDRRSISVLADEEDMKKAFGATEISTRVLTQSPSTPRKAYLPLEDVNIGTGAIITVGMLAGLMVAVVLTAVAGSAPPGLDALVVGVVSRFLGLNSAGTVVAQYLPRFALLLLTRGTHP